MRYALGLVLLFLACGCGKPAPTLAHGKPLGEWLHALHDPDARIRQKAARVLGNVGPVDPAVLPALAEAARDPDRRVRGEAAKALEKIQQSR